MPSGLGTALKPAWEPIIIARKPLAGTVAANVLEHGTGALNIDATRVGTTTETHASKPRAERNGFVKGFVTGTETVEHQHGRWPANVVLVHSEGCQQVGVRKVRGQRPREAKPHGGNVLQEAKGYFTPGRTFYDNDSNRHADPDGTETVQAWECDEESCPVFLLDQQSGELSAGRVPQRTGTNKHRAIYNNTFNGHDYGEARSMGSGGASRFFYTAKAGRAERVKVDGEQHPTVKPLALMRWLVRLVTPPGGTVLDPFCGSGSTLVAARMEGFRAIGIEADERWCEGSAMRLREHEQGQGVLDLSG